MQSDPLNYAVAGASRFAEFCLGEYHTMDEIRPVAVWDRNAVKAKALAAKFGMRVCASLEEMAAAGDIDMVHVASVPSCHAAQTLAMLRSGKHVLCEKPLATVAGDADEIVAAARTAGVRCGVNFMMRHSPVWAAIKEIVDERLLGGLLRGQVTNCAGNSGLPVDHWFWKEEVSGGIFVEHGVHFFDLLASWFGPGGKVEGAGMIQKPENLYSDQASCEVRYGGRGSAGFYHGFHQTDALDRQEVRLVFEYGEVVLKGWITGEMEIRCHAAMISVSRLRSLLPGLSRTSVHDTGSGEGDAPGLLCLKWQSTAGRQERYRKAVRGVMEDFVRGIRDPLHVLRVTAEDGVAALCQALEARTLSQLKVA